ncbi:MAG: hypothetical protein Tsb0021_12210 [Chlamydiales bacterium]
MKHHHWIKLAMTGILAGMTPLSEVFPSTIDPELQQSIKERQSENIGYRLMTEQELLTQLNYKTRRLYMSLDSEGKLLARKVASARCDGTNECKELNACRTDDNKCAGEGECKGQGKCAFADKNLAVKLVAKKMAKKRQEASKQ